MSTRADALAISGAEVNSAIETQNGVLIRTSQVITQAAHRSWVELTKLDHVLFRVELSRQVLATEGGAVCPDHTQCPLGKWYDAQRGGFSGSTAFRDIERPHEQVHACARRALDAIRAGNTADALRQLQAMDKASEATFQALERFAEEQAPATSHAGAELF
jgi:hypothetical protein